MRSLEQERRANLATYDTATVGQSVKYGTVDDGTTITAE